MPKEIQTSAPIAHSEIFDLPHIGQDKINNMKDLISRQNFPEKKKLMIEVFNSLQKGTTFQVIERNKNNEDRTDVILRQDTGNGGGHKGPRFPHGTPIELVSTSGRRENNNGYSFRTMKDGKGQDRIYVQVKVNGQEGYMAIEHIGIKSAPPPAQPSKPEVITPVGPPAPIKPAQDPEAKKPQPKEKTEAEKAQDEAKFLKEVGSLSLLKIDKKITYGEIARQYDTTVAVLNELNALELVEATVLAVGSEVNVPISKKTAPGISPAPNTTPPEKPAESEPAQGLTATLEAFKMTPEKRAIIDTVLSTPGLRFALKSDFYPKEERDLSKFRFDGKNITDPQGKTDKITGVNLEGENILIISRNGRQLIFYREQVSTAQNKPEEQAPTKIPAPAPENETNKPKVDLTFLFDVLDVDTAKREKINTLLLDQNSNLALDSGASLGDCVIGTSISVPGMVTQEIIGLDIEGKTIIITENDGTKLYFAPPKG